MDKDKFIGQILEKGKATNLKWLVNKIVLYVYNTISLGRYILMCI